MQIAVDYRVVSLSEERLNQLAAKFGIENAGKYSITSDMVDAISLSQVGGVRRFISLRLSKIRCSG